MAKKNTSLSKLPFPRPWVSESDMIPRCSFCGVETAYPTLDGECGTKFSGAQSKKCKEWELIEFDAYTQNITNKKNMSKIKLTDNLQEIIYKMSEGNPGAITVLISLMKSDDIDPQSAFGGMGSILFLDTLKIYGSEIWVLYKDICGENIARVIALLRAVQLGILPEKSLKDSLSDYMGARNIPAAVLDLPNIFSAVKSRLSGFKFEKLNMELPNESKA